MVVGEVLEAHFIRLVLVFHLHAFVFLGFVLALLFEMFVLILDLLKLHLVLEVKV